jgi:hypothetical protein
MIKGQQFLDEVHHAMVTGAPLSDAIQDAVKSAVFDYRMSAVRSIDDALDLARPKGWNQTGAINRARYQSAVYASVKERLFFSRGEIAIDESLFESIVADLELPISWSTARKMYLEAKDSFSRGGHGFWLSAPSDD